MSSRDAAAATFHVYQPVQIPTPTVAPAAAAAAAAAYVPMAQAHHHHHLNLLAALSGSARRAEEETR
ncbi:hypothetical protein ABZP36_031516 [Zizania latifolia]